MSIEELLSKAVVKHGIDILNKYSTDPENLKSYIQRLFDEHLDYPIPKDKVNPDNWFIPQRYKDIDIEGYLMNQCPPENRDRLSKELQLYQKNNMIPVLKAMKYIVDTLRNNKVLWGVGRGSSVASYALFLLGVHKVDSVKYSLPIEEFFKGEENG
jgi:DNA polymerase III alpha subunit